MKGIKIGRVGIKPRKNTDLALASSSSSAYPDKIVAPADIKKAAVRGVFGRKKTDAYAYTEPVADAYTDTDMHAITNTDANTGADTIAEPVTDIVANTIAEPVTEMKKTRIKPTRRDVKQMNPEIIEEIKGKIIDTQKCNSETTDPAYTSYETQIVNIEKNTKYVIDKDQVYQPANRYFFSRMIPTIYKDFSIDSRTPVDYDACKKMSLQTYNYQRFIREYMRLESPSRGILVYHGLGSGKTCSAIGAAEAIFSDSAFNMPDEKPRKIIVLTPVSLQENFINEISFCGFRHYNVKNNWTAVSIFDAKEETYNMALICFAKSVLHIPDKYINSLRENTSSVIWIPDFTKESNFDSKSPDEQDQIKRQIRETIRSRIEFLGYTGLTRQKLKEWAINDPTHFDNAVIIIDEVHNLTRLMRGRLDKYLTRKEPKKGAKKDTTIPISYEPITTQRWVPKLVTQDKHYDRAFLFYRLLAEAQNSKIIALSGTPIVNYPDEIAILGNILHGYFHAATLICTAVPNADAIKNILEKHERVDFYSVESAEKSSVFFTLLEKGFKKTYKTDGSFEGVIYDGEISTIEAVVEEIKIRLAEIRVVVQDKIVEALPLFPVGKSDFEKTFINTQSARMQNSFVFLKRMSGLISYYKGGRKDYMPAVNRDIIVEIPMSNHMLGPYIESRASEREIEKIKQTGEEKRETTESVGWGVISALPSESNKKAVASYRFRSRAMCNFVFPKGIARPFPTKAADAVKAATVATMVLGDTSEKDLITPPPTLQEQTAAAAVLDAQVGELEAEETEIVNEEGAPVEDISRDSGIVGEDIAEEEKKKLEAMPYDERIRYTVEKLEANRDTYFKLVGADPTNRLDTYSPKFTRIIENIGAAAGSSLVYSQFKTLEGIGILGIAMKANGYEQVRIMMSEGVMKFHADTIASFRERPTQPRYMIFSGEEPREVRQALINTFNMNWDAGLTKELREILNSARGLKATGNMKGEVCRVFMITGAGAEGLSLKNVRAVHLMEPYWNKVRMDQVKGRAVRICSHKDLPQKDRNVDIFTYVSVITKEQMASAQEIEFQDEGLTSDQYIYNVSIRKEKLNNDFLNTIQVGAVDCQLNQIENNMYKCFEISKSAQNNFLYDPRLVKDIATTLTEFGEQNKEVKQRVVKEMPASILEKSPASIKSRVMAGSKLIYTEMIADDGAHYYGIFSSDEYTHPQPYDADRELGLYDSKTGKVTFKKIRPTVVAPIVGSP